MDIHLLRSRIAFIDVEASGLMKGAFPVEIAWRSNSESADILLNPTNIWNEDCWDRDAEAMHGLSLGELKRKGRHPRQAAAMLEKGLKGLMVFSDSPVHDIAWLDMLHAAAGIPRTYKVETVGKLLGFMGTKADCAFRIFSEARVSHPPRGRAVKGVEHLQQVFELAAAEAQRR